MSDDAGSWSGLGDRGASGIRGGGGASDSDDEGGPSSGITPLPKRKLFVLSVILFCDALSFTQLFPYVAFMIRDELEMTSDTQAIGYYAGFLTSAFSAAAFCTSFFWGKVSDRYGRRVALLSGLTGTLVVTFGFGFAETFGMAIFWRATHGIMNGNIGIVKSYLAEVTDPTNKSRAFALIGVVGGAGRIVGPMMGGLLYNVAPDGDGFLTHYPHVLPCLLSGLITMVGWVGGFLFLPETVKNPDKLCGKSYARLRDEAGAGGAFELDSRSSDSAVGLVAAEASAGQSGSGTDMKIGGGDGDAEAGLRRRTGGERRNRGSLRDPHDDEEGIDTTKRWYWCSRAVMISTALYGSLALMWILEVEIWPLFATAQLNFTPAQIGVVYAIGAGWLVIYQLGVYPRIERRWGVITLFKASSLATAPFFLLFPFLDVMTGSKVIYAVLVPALALRFSLSLTCFTSVFIIISNAGPESHLGKINGLGQSYAALARAVGPAMGATLYAVSLKSDLPFPLNEKAMYCLMAIIAVGNFFLVSQIPSYVGSGYLKPSQRGAAVAAAPSDDGDADRDDVGGGGGGGDGGEDAAGGSFDALPAASDEE